MKWKPQPGGRTMQRWPSGFAPGTALLILLMLLLGDWFEAGPPRRQHDLCAVLAQHPAWYDDARAAETHWGVSAATLLAFIQLESAFRREARPPREYIHGIVPWRRPSSAFGYGQIQDGVWQDYLRDRPGFLRSRQDMGDVLDFVGWYNRGTIEQLGIPADDTRRLYLAYHEGRTGYRSGRWQDKLDLLAYVERVVRRAAVYNRQLSQCAARFECDGWLEFGPWCSTDDA